nr:Ig-like domain-containing protein [Mangrovicoccus sp. HB161399]
MKFAAVLVYDRALDETERAQVESYLQEKYITGPVIQPPLAVDDSASTVMGTEVVIDVLANDQATEGDAFAITAVGAPGNGTAEIDTNDPSDPADDLIRYIPAVGFVGTDSFTYSITDDDGTSTATVSVTVDYPVGEAPPVAADDSAGTDINTSVLIDVLANDTDADGEIFEITAIGPASAGQATLDDGGTADPSDDQILYVPATDFLGTATFTYEITGDDGTSSATVSVDVILPPELQVVVAEDDSVSVLHDSSVLIDVLANDSDAAGESFSIIQLGTPTNGTAVLEDYGTADPFDDRVLYTPNGSFIGTDSFSYTVADDDGTSTATVTVTVRDDAPTGPLSLEGFSNEEVLTRDGIPEPDFQPISMAFLPDNRMLLLSKTGVIRIVDPETGNNELYMTLDADTNGERGLLDITLDPDFETNGYFYLYYTPADPKNAVIARFQHQENSGGLTARGDASSEFTVWTDTDGYIKCCHYGAGLDFGPDGKLWLTASDKFQSSTIGEGNGDDRMLDLTSSTGKIIRINSDGTIPDGTDGWAANPFIDGPGGNDDSIWAYGLRNPFRARWDFEYGQMYIGEVGGNQQDLAHEDLHTTSLEQAGAFYGWPFYEGTENTFTSDGRSAYDPADFPQPDNDIANAAEGDYYSAPIWSLPHDALTNSLTGGEVYRGDMFPSEWDGVYFYGNYTKNYIRYLVLDDTGLNVLGDYEFLPSDAMGDEPRDVVSIVAGEDGALYYARIASGIVGRIVYEGSNVNFAPDIVSAGVDELQGALPFEVTYTAVVTDADGDAMTYLINFGDGSAAVSGDVAPDGTISVSHTYSENGIYEVSFSVSDGGKTSLAQSIQVQAGEINLPPEITGEESDIVIGQIGTEITYTASVSDPEDDTLTYTWYFGDGQSATGVVGTDGTVTATHSFDSDGTYGAYLEVNDGTQTTRSDDIFVQIGEASEFPVGAGLVLLLEADIKIGVGDGNTVISWLDGSGQGNNLFAQGDPILADNQTPTGKPAIVFDGDADLLQRVASEDSINNLPSGSDDRTVFFVVDYIAPENVSAGFAFGDSQVNQTFGTVANRKGFLGVQGYGGSKDITSDVDGVAGGFLVQSAIVSADTVSHYHNGTLIDTQTHTYATDLQKIILGADMSGDGEAQMKIAAVMVYDRALSESERQRVESFLQSKYITSGPVASAPVAVDDPDVTVEQGATTLIDVLANDSDADGDVITITAVGAAAHGTAEIDDGGTPGDPTDDVIRYVSDASYVGTDSFEYTIADDDGEDTATVTVTVTAPVGSNPPIAADDSATTAQNVAVLIDALANDTEIDGDVLAISALGTATNGTVTLDDNGTPGDTADDLILYTPNLDFTGTDSFTYTVSDDDGSSTGTVTVTVRSVETGLVETGLIAAYQSDAQVSTIGDMVIGWIDESGYGNDLEAAGDPTLVTNATPTGQAAVVFDGDGDFLERLGSVDTLNSLPSTSSDRTMFFVVDYTGDNLTSAGFAYGDGQVNQTFGLTTAVADQSLTLQGYGGKNDFDSDTPADGWVVQSVVLSGNDFSHYLNGGLIDSGTHEFNTDPQRIVIGEEIAGAATKGMEVAAAFIYDEALSDADRISMENYLQQKYIDDAFLFA